mgnify:CR=1 FL=1
MEPAVRFAELGVATTYEAAGRSGLVQGAFLRVVPGARAAGWARTVQCAPADNLAVHQALAVAGPGEIVVVAAPQPCRVSLLGGLLATQARARGVAGILLDGPVRDVDEIAELGLPVWARGADAAGAGKLGPAQLDVPVLVGGVHVAPGDLVVLDGDGAAVVGADLVDEVLAAAEGRHARELGLLDRLEAGESTLDLLGLR